MKITNTSLLLFACFVSLLSLAAALIAQYGFNLKPCELCLAQRVPYALVIMLSLIGLSRPAFRPIIILLIGGLFIVEAGLATYHAAVEQHWIAGPTACTSEPSPAGGSLDDLLKKIKQAPVVMCDQPAWDFHGITMAAMNAAWSLCLAATVFIARRKVKPYV